MSETGWVCSCNVHAVGLVREEQRGPVDAGYFHGVCWCCEPAFGRADETCEARSALESLSLDMDIREEQMHEEEEARAPMRSPRT